MRKIVLAGCALLLLLASHVQASEGFKPTGTLGFSQTFYGNAGNYQTATAHPSLYLDYNFAPQWKLHMIWDRTWSLNNYDGQAQQQYSYFSQPAATLSYQLGNLWGTGIKGSTSLQFENQTDMRGNSSNYLYAQTTFDFAHYMPKSDWIQATQFAIAPQYVYGWNSEGGRGHVNTVGLALLTQWQLPANFSLTVNAYAFREWYSGAFTLQGVGNASYSSANYLVALVWLTYQKTLLKFNPDTSLAFNFIGGLDPYMTSNRNASWMPFIATNAQYEWLDPVLQVGTYQSTYILFALPQLRLTYRVNSQLSLHAFLQVKYSNQVWGEQIEGWRFQPQGGFGVTFNF